MAERPARPFPFDEVDDLVAILRVVYWQEKQKRNPSTRSLAVIRTIAEELKQAAAYAQGHEPGSPIVERALKMADAATLKIEHVHFPEIRHVDDPANPLITSAVARIQKNEKPPKKHEESLGEMLERHRKFR